MKINCINVGEIFLLLLLILRCNILIAAKYRSFSKNYETLYNHDHDHDHCHDHDHSHDHDDKYSSFSMRRPRPNNRVAGGYTAKEGEFPSFVSLTAKQGMLSSLCSGVAISDRLILTAAHCFYPRSTTWRKIVAAPGIRRPNPWELRENKVKTYDVEKSCRSSFYNDKAPITVHDYQVLRLRRPIPGMSYSLLAGSDPKLGAHAVAVGIGLIDNTVFPNKYADSLQALPVQRVRCDSRGRPSHICFQSYSPDYVGDTCQGDSGGPIFMKGTDGRHVIVGLTSFGQPTCKAGFNEVSFNANVYSGLQEIQDLVKQCS